MGMNPGPRGGGKNNAKPPKGSKSGNRGGNWGGNVTRNPGPQGGPRKPPRSNGSGDANGLILVIASGLVGIPVLLLLMLGGYLVFAS